MIANANSIVQHVIKIKNGTKKHANMGVKIIEHAKKIIVGILAHVFARMISIYKVLLMIPKLCVMKLYVLNIVSKNVASIILANVTSTMLTHSDYKKVRYKTDCYILHAVLLVIILLYIITIISYHYAKDRSK